MTNGPVGDDRLSKNERRDAAREKAKTLREEHKKKEKRGRWIVQGSIILVSVAIVASVALVIVNSIRPPSPGPLNMLSDGITIGENLVASRTAALQPGDDPVTPTRDDESTVIDIQVYVDYLCPFCGEFEKVNGDTIEQLVGDGAATVTYHPIAILTSKSAGTQYSLRAANAAACVANYAPDSFFAFNTALFNDQPEEGSVGLSDDELIAIAKSNVDGGAAAIESCIKDFRFKNWVQDATTRAVNGPIANSDVTSVSTTPTIIVNGAKYSYTSPFTAEEFSTFVVQAAGQSFDDTSTPTPTPTPAP